MIFRWRSFFAWWSCSALLTGWVLLGWVLTAAPPVGAAPGESIFHGVDLVVLTGIPGDVESESAYRRQMADFLERLATAGTSPRRITWLSDEGEAATLPDLAWDTLPWPVERRPASRRDFQALTAELAGSRHPLVVVAWGHGGTVRETPVLHVRGPRIEPGDLVALAHAVAAPSRWLLFFRHSGAFAGALAGDGREILASEHATAFKSDPVTVDRLLEALAAGRVASLETLARAVARRTVDWYDEQHLARQEEPTLWLETNAPRVLAAELDTPAEDAASPVAVADETATDGATTEGATTETPVAPSWDEIAPVDPADHPGHDTVILRRRLRHTLAESPAYSELREEVVQILRPAGTRWGDLDLAYSPPDETLTLLDVEVLQRDGRLVRLRAEDVRDVTANALPGYRAPTRKLVTLPEVGVGSILRIRYRREWKTFPLPHVPLELPLLADVPILRSELEVEVDRRSPLHWHLAGQTERLEGASLEPRVDERPYGASHVWVFDDLPAWPREPLASPLAAPRLLVSTFPSWPAFGEWYRRLVQKADEPTPEMAALAAELTAGAASPREKVRRVYDWVTQLRYIAIPLGVNSHRPHAAANVFENRYGDCKDKANLFNTMLGTLGIEADLVLVPRFSQAYEATPGLGFNHAISRVRLDDEVIWADTTDEVAPFGLLPPGDPGRRVLVVAEGERSLTALPRPLPQDHRLELRGTVRLGPGATEAPAAELELEATGFPEYALRLAARRGFEGPLLRSALVPANGLFAAADETSGDPSALDRDFGWRGRGSWNGLTSRLGEHRTLVSPPLWWPEAWGLALHARQTPLFLEQGYPLTLTQSIELLLPPGAVAGEAPEPRSQDEGPLSWRLAWRPLERAGSERGWRLELELVLETGELDGDQSKRFQHQARALREALSQGAWYEPTRSDATD